MLQPRQAPPTRSHARLACLLVLNLENFVAARAPRRRHLGAVALGLADQCARNGGRDRNLAIAHVRLVLADDLVFDLVAGILILQRDRRAKLDFVAAELGGIDDLGAADLVLNLGHLGLVEPLRLLSSVVLGILGQIAVLPSVRNLLNDARTLLDLEAVQLGLELLEPLDGHRHFFHGHGLFSQIGRTQRPYRNAVSLSHLGLATLLSAVSRGILRTRRLHRIAAALPQGCLPQAPLWLAWPPGHQPKLYSKECG